MADANTSIKVFLSSPGDVQDERNEAEKVIKGLASHPVLSRRISISRCIAWDRGGGVPMYADLSPQESIDLGMEKPSQCDIVVVILWSRFGSKLDKVKPDGNPYLSGTEWEYLNARNAGILAGRSYKPYILIYRCIRDVSISPNDEKLEDRLNQLLLVQNFFKAFRNEQGTFQGFYTEYKTLEEFKKRLELDLRKTILERILSA